MGAPFDHSKPTLVTEEEANRLPFDSAKWCAEVAEKLEGVQASLPVAQVAQDHTRLSFAQAHTDASFLDEAPAAECTMLSEGGLSVGAQLQDRPVEAATEPTAKAFVLRQLAAGSYVMAARSNLR